MERELLYDGALFRVVVSGLYATIEEIETGVKCSYMRGRFNDTQEITIPDERRFLAGGLPTILRKIGDLSQYIEREEKE